MQGLTNQYLAFPIISDWSLNYLVCFTSFFFSEILVCAFPKTRLEGLLPGLKGVTVSVVAIHSHSKS